MRRACRRKKPEGGGGGKLVRVKRRIARRHVAAAMETRKGET